MTRHLLAVATAAALTVTGVAQASNLHGTVVHRNHKAHSFVVANAAGQMSAVHATRSPRIGSKVSLKATRLTNGTYKGAKVRAHGRAHRARIRGIVTFVDRAHNRFTLSSRGVSLLVRMAHRPRQAGTTTTLPSPGSDVTVTSNLDQSDDSTVVTTPGSVQSSPTPPAAGTPVSLEGTILSIDTTTRTLMLSADDSNASGQAISVTLPDTFDITAFHVGDQIEILATLNSDGTTYTAVASSGDQNAQQADNQGEDQGDSQQFNSEDGNDMSVADATTLCQQQQADPNFAASHDGKTFDQFYTPEDNMTSFQKCVDENSHGQSQDSSNSGDSNNSGPGSGDQSGSTSTSTSGDQSGSTSGSTSGSGDQQSGGSQDGGQDS